VFTTLVARVALFGIGLTWLGLRIVYWNGYYTEDAPGYVTDAIWLALGQFGTREYVNGLNIGTYAPVAIPIWLLGKSEVALTVWPIACSLLGMASLAGLSVILFGRPFGLLAAFLYATYPGDVFFSTVVMPDSLQAGWLSCSIFLVAFAYVRPAAQKGWILTGAGLAMGFCHLIRANDLILAPVGIAAVVILSTVWKSEALPAAIRGCLFFLCGWVLVYVVEGLAYFLTANDFLLRFRVVNQHYGSLSSISTAGLNIDASTIPFSAFAPFMWWTRGGWGSLNQDQSYHALIFSWGLLGLLIGVGTVLARMRSGQTAAIAGLALAAVWFTWPLLYHQFGSQSVTRFVPMHRLSRHLVVYAPGAIFAAVAGCFFLASPLRQVRGVRLQPDRSRQLVNGRRMLAVGGTAVLVIHLYFNWVGEEIVHGAYQGIKGTYTRIRERLPDNVQSLVADPGDLAYFDFWLNPLGVERVRMMAFANYSRCEQIENGVVLTRSNPGWDGMSAPIIQDTVRRLPCLVDPPPSWRLLYEGYPERVYAIETGREARQ
jgi:hypothetical protein